MPASGTGGIPFYGGILDSCIASKDLRLLTLSHAQVITRGIYHNDLIRSKLVGAYAACGEMPHSARLFSLCHRRSAFLYNSLIRGYASTGMFASSLVIFRDMLHSRKPVDRHTLPSVLKSCSGMSALRLGRQVHGAVVALGYDSDAANCNAVMSLYSKCGGFEEAQKVFDRMPVRNEVTWTIMIAACGAHGKFAKVLELFGRMVAGGMKVDGVCLTAVLSACSHGGMVDEGLEVFVMMKDRFGVRPGLQHYTCVVDMLGRAGRVEEAKDVVSRMDVRPDTAVWTALLGACRTHANLELAEQIAAQTTTDELGIFARSSKHSWPNG